MKKCIRVAVLFISFLVLTIAMILLFNPLLNPATSIEKQVLKTVPVGTTINDAIYIIENHPKWKIDYIRYDGGYKIDSQGLPGESGSSTVGEMSVRINLGHYRIVFRTDVIAFLGFDSDSGLISVAIRKYTDSL